ncbi:MAG: MGH1-like glycoside hydrolase domain-containing protein [Fidelibacterota bacterium]
MRKIFLFSSLIFGFMACDSGRELYTNDTFTIFKDKVVQDDYAAEVISDHDMISNFRSDYKMPTKKVLDFKFALNGMDNERHPGEDHHLVLNPVNGRQTSPVYTFAETDPPVAHYDELQRNEYLDENVTLTIRCDMRSVLQSFAEKGFYRLYNGEKFYAKDFKGVFVAGSTLPLNWDFANLIDRPEFRMKDTDQDSIYTVTFDISKYQTVDDTQFNSHWKLTKDITGFPQLDSDIPLLDALYTMSLEELLLDVREDNTFMAGAKWPGVWTRDISYSIILSLAAIAPEISKKSLMKKVDENRIIQDTGTGGSWPVSSDRTIWAVAAWEVYKTTGDKDWLTMIYKIIKNSAGADLAIVYDDQFGLFRGESSFLDWREQTYSRWMEPKDIYRSMNLSTNAAFYETFRILSEMATILGENGAKYRKIADQLKAAVNEHLWMPEKGYYGQYLYGRNFMRLSPKSETLGEALCILFDIADEKQAERILAQMPVIDFGPTCIFPQIPNIPPYHNDGIWPFVVAYWTLAAKKGNNIAAMNHGLASIYRSAALYLSNYENMVAETGDFMGTEINSQRQLWSVAGNLAMIYKIFFGMDFQSDGLNFAPVIPKSYGGEYHLSGFNYQDAVLDINIEGWGNEIETITLDGAVLETSKISNDLTGDHKLEIIMSNRFTGSHKMNLADNQYSPETPKVKLAGNQLSWEPVTGAEQYIIFYNGEKIKKTNSTEMTINSQKNLSEYQVKAVNSDGLESFLSEPVKVVIDKMVLPAKELFGKKEYWIDHKESTEDRFTISVDTAGDYYLYFQYSNGAGPVNTSNKCAVRKLSVNDQVVAPVIFPQRGSENWEEIGITSPIKIDMQNGTNAFNLIYDEDCENMNKMVNKAIIHGIKLVPVK